MALECVFTYLKYFYLLKNFLHEIMLTKLIVVIILQYIHVSNHCAVYPKEYCYM